MARSKFTEETCLGLVELIADGATLEEAARQVGVRTKTVRDWLTRGRRENGTPYADFAAAVEAAREEVDDKAQGEMDEAEFLGHVSKMVRAGNVRAMDLWWRIHQARARRGDGEATNPFDQLDADTESDGGDVVPFRGREAS